MNILLLNHGPTEATDLGLIEGRADYSLNREGREMAEDLAAYIRKNFRVSRIYSSPLRRTVETAEAVSKATDIPVETMDELIEMNNGHLAGISKEKVVEKLHNEDIPDHSSSHAMEPKLDFKMRAEKALSRIISENHEGEFIVVVSHSSMISQITRAFLELPVSSETVFACLPGALNQMFLFNGTRGIVTVNSTSHMR